MDRPKTLRTMASSSKCRLGPTAKHPQTLCSDQTPGRDMESGSPTEPFGDVRKIVVG